jgi:3'-phosphoadenosine 5'-phosphosulfate sulfotransferase (PAPS reductase)/FAD synthetase
VAQARAEIGRALAACQQPFVAVSGGKDSLALLHLVTRAHPEVLSYHWDYGPRLMPREVEAEALAAIRAAGGRRLMVRTSRRYTDPAQHGPVWYQVYFGREVPRLQRLGYDLAFVGLRAAESGKRRRRIAARQALSAIPESWPLARWTWLDVWAYLVEHALPYPRVYDRQAALVGWEHARFVTFHDPEFARLGAESVDGVLHWRWRHGTTLE